MVVTFTRGIANLVWPKVGKLAKPCTPYGDVDNAAIFEGLCVVHWVPKVTGVDAEHTEPFGRNYGSRNLVPNHFDPTERSPN